MLLHYRKEFFGAVIFDPIKAKYFNLSNETAAQLKSYIDSPSKDIPRVLSPILNSAVGNNDPIKLAYVNNSNQIKNQLSAPLKGFLNITKKCNLFCGHCYNNSGLPDSPELPLYSVTQLLTELEKRGIFKITLSGGEPLIHRNFEQIVSHLGTTSLAASIVTNGIPITINRAQHLANTSNIRSITVSLDGGVAEDNDMIRGKGSFQLSTKGLEIIRDNFPRSIAIRVSLMKNNIGNLGKIVALANKLDISEIKVNPTNPYGRAKAQDSIFLSNEEYTRARQKLYEKASEHDIKVEVPSLKYRIDNNDQLGLCRAGEETFEVDADGSVYPCSFTFGKLAAGNIFNDSYDDVFSSLIKHSINNNWCYACKGRGGKVEKKFGHIPKLIEHIEHIEHIE